MGAVAWVKYPGKDMVVTVSYSSLEYYLATLVGPRKEAQFTLPLPQRMV